MYRVEKTHLPVAALTHAGMKGKNNEDRFGVVAFRTRTTPPIPVLLAVLSDGIGGHRAGEVASELAVNIISQHVAESEGRNPLQTLEEAIHRASRAIFQQATENTEQQGMGATCACAWIAGDRLFTATVGDSRIYLLRGSGTIQQLSTDHTWIQEALDRGLLQPDQVSGHPNAHVIRRYLGSPVPPEVDFRIRGPEGDVDPHQGLKLQPGDRLLLCSDGLTDLVDDPEILGIFNQGTLEEAGQQLIDLANQRGGHDNITLVAIQVPEAAAKTAPVPVGRSRVFTSRAMLVGCLGVIALAVVVGALAGGWLLFSGEETPTPTGMPALPLTTTAGPSPSPTPTRTRSATPTPFSLMTATPTQTLPSGLFPTVTPVRLNTATPQGNQPLPVVTVNP